ncbi:MAG: hypothetical protein WA047_04265 [Phenylobacterium sp.]|uniref:hypothetical protein n=1 Tax=Phenylobacterium sp. TaxID=1871053 RepID=UPI003BB52122
MRRGSGATILDREIEWASTAFLEGRLAEKATFDWAAGLSSDKVAERNAIRTLLNYRDPKPEEPYRTAWFWVCEAWDEPSWPDEARLEMTEALQRGVAPLTFVRHVIELVRPRLTVEPAPRRKGRITDVSRLISLNLGAEDLVSLEDLSLDAVPDVAFFSLLANQLEGELRYGMARSARIGGSAVYLANWIERVYPAQLVDPNGGFSDPDEYRRGFGPLVKLLHQVVAKLFTLAPNAARDHVQGWLRYPDALFQRLWAAAARNPGLATIAEVGTFLRTVDADRFWSIGHFPEITELRGRRFAELTADDQVAIERRLLQTPPAALFLRRLSKSERDPARRSWTQRELRRVEVGGGVPSEAVKAWTADFAANGETYTTLTSVTSDLDNAYNFPWLAEIGAYDADDIKDVLPVLERDLAETDYGGKAEAAASYSHAHADDVLEALEASEPGRYPRVLASLAEWEARRGRGTDAHAAGGLDVRARKVLDALVRLSAADLEASASAFSGWLNVWAKHLAADRRIWVTWMRLWPTAVALSNKAPVIVSVSASGSREDRNDRLAMEALNSPAGHLISALFSVLPDLTVVPHPFEGEDLRRVRDAAFTATGDARLQVLHRFLSALEYMRSADPQWTEVNLLRPLAQAEHQDLEIWDAIARRGVSPESLKIIGPRLVMVARGGSLPAKTRAGLARTATYAVLRNLKDAEEPIIPLADVQQMLRLGGDQVRIASARTLKDFLLAKGADPVTQFTSAVETFLRQVWPADQTLRTGPLSDALAELPAAAGAAFPAAVAAVADFIVPFDAWSLHAFGFYSKVEGSEGPRRKTAPSMNRDEAASWLDLLDRSIGRSEGAVYPRDMALALDAISSGDKALMTDPRFQRLVSLVRK